MEERAEDLMEKIVGLAKRRGFVFPGSDIYGGLANSWDYGPYGVALKNNIKNEWWKEMVVRRENVVGLDSAIIMNPKTWEASGHLAKFADPLVDCEKCKRRFRADDLQDKKKCPECEGKLKEAREFNLMFKTFIGPVDDQSEVAYLRPETAQGIFTNFKNVTNVARQKLPFGIAQIGKAFRNEITPRNFIFRTREFEQAELEYFVKPTKMEAGQWFKYWVKARFDWYLKLGMKKMNLKLRKHDKRELAHYALETTDIEYNFPFGISELEGIASRGDFDLKAHEKASRKDLMYFDEATHKSYWPYVVEPSMGIDRAMLAFLVDAYAEEKAGKDETRTVLKLHPKLSPVKIAIFPLVKKAPLVKMAKQIHRELKEHFMAEYDEAGSIGKRYRRQDEIGTPYCLTVDFDSLKNKKVTLRHRDTMKQTLMKTGDLVEFFKKEFK